MVTAIKINSIEEYNTACLYLLKNGFKFDNRWNNAMLKDNDFEDKYLLIYPDKEVSLHRHKGDNTSKVFKDFDKFLKKAK